MTQGVYCITFSSGDKYVGSSTCIEERRRAHMRALAKGKGVSRALQSAYNALGVPGFETLEIVRGDVDNLIAAEEKWIVLLQPRLNVVRRPQKFATGVHTGKAKPLWGCNSYREAAQKFGVSLRQAKYAGKLGLPPPAPKFVGPVRPFWAVEENGRWDSPAGHEARRRIADQKRLPGIGALAATLGIVKPGTAAFRYKLGWSAAQAVGVATKQRTRNMNRSKYLTYQGREQTIADWAAETGVNPGTIHNRLRANWSAAQALGFEKGPKAQACEKSRALKEAAEAERQNKLFEYQGGRYTVSELARRFSAVSYATLYARLRAGWPVDKALS